MVANNDFVHLHVHSHGSLLDGMGKMNEYVSKVSELGQRGLGISDHGNVFLAYELIQKARAAGLIAVPGCEFYVAPQNPEGAKVKSPVFYGPRGEKAAQYDVSSNGAYTHQTIFAINNVGLKNLFKLSTLSFDPERVYSKPRIDIELLAEYSEGLVAFTGCPSSEISTRFLLGQDKKAYEYANRLKEIFGDRLFVEIMEHGMNSPIERLLLPKQLELSRKMGIPLVATNDAHYTNQNDHTHHEEMLCSQSGSSMKDETWDNGGPRFAFDGSQFYLKTAQEMAEIFSPEDFPNALSNTNLIAEMAQDISMSYDPTLKPKAIVPEGHQGELDYFKYLINKGFNERYGNASPEIKKRAKDQVDYEFEVIHSSNYVGYFLTVFEYLDYAREKYSTRDELGNILASSIGVGRGSVGGSIIAYLLYVSELDPIRYGTVFERFLSAGRGDTYEIVYDDGSREVIIVSEKKKTTDDQVKYIHELEVGDIIVDAVPTVEEDPEPAPPTLPEAEVPVPVALQEEAIMPEAPVEAPAKKRKQETLALWNDLGVIPKENLTDLSNIPF